MDRWRGRERSDGWSGLSVHLVVGFWAGLTAGEMELLADARRCTSLAGAGHDGDGRPTTAIPPAAPVGLMAVPATQTGADGGAGVHHQTWHVIHE